MRAYDKILHDVGAFGRYQKIVVFLYACPTAMHSVWIYYMLNFIMMDPLYSCKSPDSPRQVFDDTGACESNSSLGGTCEHGFVYDFDHNGVGRTVRSEWDLFCDRRMKGTLMFTCSQTGEVIGLLVLTVIMDNIGRWWCLVLGQCWVFVTSLILFFLYNFEAMYAVVFFRGFALRMAFYTPWIVVQEVAGEEYVSRLYLLLGVCWAVGFALLSLIGWATRNWRHVVLITLLPCLMVLPQAWYIYETPRFYAARGQFQQARRVIRAIAKINGKDPDKLELNELEGLRSEKVGKKVGVWSLFSNGRCLAVKTVVLCGMNIIVFVVYVGQNYNMENFRANPYVVQAFMALVEIPACLCSPLADRLGRVFLTSFSFFMAGTFSLIGVAVFDVNEALPVAMAVFTKFFITLGFNFLLILVAETFPTVAKSSSTGLLNLVSLLCVFSVPYIVQAAKTINMLTLPMVIFSCSALLGSFLVLIVPETMSKGLVDTFEEEKKTRVSTKHLKTNLRNGWKSTINLICRRRTVLLTEEKCGASEKMTTHGNFENGASLVEPWSPSGDNSAEGLAPESSTDVSTAVDQDAASPGKKGPLDHEESEICRF